jgi:HTH-type transcriptional regulator/antitoxin HigA
MMESLTYTVIKSQNQYKAYCDLLVDLMKPGRKTRIELDSIDLLTLLTQQWEEEQRPLSDADPVEFLQSLMKRNNVTSSELAAGIGISKSLLSDIIHYRRRLSREVIRKIASRFNVSQNLLNKPYNLATVVKSATSLQPFRQPKSQPPGNPFLKDQPLIQILNDRTGRATLAKLKNGKTITIWNIMSGRRLGDSCSYLITNVKPKIADSESDMLFTSAVSELFDPDTDQAIFHAGNGGAG